MDAKTITAAVCREFGKPLEIEEVLLSAPGLEEIEVAVEAVAICHSDISYADGDWGGALPAVYGHEAAGRIRAVGDGVGGLAEGDPVVVTLIRSCGRCPSCAEGAPTRCESPPGPDAPLRTKDGGDLHQAMACGAFAERVVVHRSQVAPIPGDMAMDAACLLACGVITGVGAAVYAAGLRPGQDAVVIGAGGVGLSAIQGARLAGARRIVAVDLSESKLEDARAFGATDAVLATGDKPWRAAKAALGGGAHAVLVTAGAAKAYDEAPRYLAAGGRIVMVGMPATGAFSSYEPANFAALSQGMAGSKMGNVVIARDIPWMIDMYRQGRILLDELISRRWRFEEINDAIADTRAGAARRNVIVMDSPASGGAAP